MGLAKDLLAYFIYFVDDPTASYKRTITKRSRMTKKKVFSAACVIYSTMLVGCMTTTPSKGFISEAESVKGDQKIPTAAKIPLHITPLNVFNDEWTPALSSGLEFSDSYTRLSIIADPMVADAGSFSYNERKWYSRAIVGMESSLNLTANISVGGFESTVPLATLGHQSDSAGEQWNRVIHHSKLNFPLFLVRADGAASVPVVKLSVKGTRSYASRGAAAAVQIALGVVQATGQAPAVVTRLSEQSTKDKSRAVDDAISKLFASGVTEEHWTDRDLRLWSVDEKRVRGVRVTFRMPETEENWNADAEVGSWTISFDYPRPSIFSDWRTCLNSVMPRCQSTRSEAEKKVRTEFNTGQVLNYALVSGIQGLGTIRSFLSQQEWYVSDMSGLASSFSTTAPNFCRRVVNEITGLGLNGFDAGIVLWSVVNGMPMPAGVNFSSIPDCTKYLFDIDKDRMKS